MRKFKLLALIAASLAGMCQVVPGVAGGIYKRVWFPDGRIQYEAKNMPGCTYAAVNRAFEYLSERTPLIITEFGGLPAVRCGITFRGNGVTQTTVSSGGRLRVHGSNSVFADNFGGLTYGYWTENGMTGNALIELPVEIATGQTIFRKNVTLTLREPRFDFDSYVDTMLHEMGHVLGFAHEFQRPDRDAQGVTIAAGKKLDIWNYKKINEYDTRPTSPYDHNSRFADGYPGVTPTPAPPQTRPATCPASPSATCIRARMSIRDINSIYRVYGRGLTNGVSSSDRFGRAVTAGDFDGDGIDDLVIAANRAGATPAAPRNLTLFFYKGVELAEQEDADISFMPWFSHVVGPVPAGNGAVVLESGDFRRAEVSVVPDNGPVDRHFAGLDVVPGRDDIDELAVGLPGADNGAGRVLILTINTLHRFELDDMPYGGRGVMQTETITAAGAGLLEPGVKNFGASLAAGRLPLGTTGTGDDLAVGAPGWRRVSPATTHQLVDPRSGIVVVLPQGALPDAVRIEPPDGDNDVREFGAAVAMIPERFSTSMAARRDALAIGAPASGAILANPRRGAVFVYPRFTNTYVLPGPPQRVDGTSPGGEFGSVLKGFATSATNGNREYHLLIGAPGENNGTGKVELWRFPEQNQPGRERIVSMPGGAQGDRFGSSFDVHMGRCVLTACRQNRVWVGIGAPGAQSGRGALVLWDVWAQNGFNTPNRLTVRLGSLTSRGFGRVVSAVRPRFGGGGFAIGEPMGLSTGGAPSARSGRVTVAMNKAGPNSWSTFDRALSSRTPGDLLPDNL